MSYFFEVLSSRIGFSRIGRILFSKKRRLYVSTPNIIIPIKNALMRQLNFIQEFEDHEIFTVSKEIFLKIGFLKEKFKDNGFLFMSNGTMNKYEEILLTNLNVFSEDNIISIIPFNIPTTSISKEFATAEIKNHLSNTKKILKNYSNLNFGISIKVFNYTELFSLYIPLVKEYKNIKILNLVDIFDNFSNFRNVLKVVGFKEETPETIVIIVSLPVETEIFGDDLIRVLSTEIREKFEDQLYKIIESEIASESVIKSPKVLERFEEGNKIKVFLRELIDKTIKHYFSKIIKKKSDSTSIKAQKAISYFSMKGFEFSPLSSLRGKDSFSDIELFDPQKKSVDDLNSKPPLSINTINFIENSQEIEIMVQNNKKEELKNISIVISHVKEYFEKEIMSQVVDDWYPGEELLFISPIVPHIDEYLISIKKGDSKEEDQTFFTQRIDLKLIDKIES